MHTSKSTHCFGETRPHGVNKTENVNITYVFGFLHLNQVHIA